MKPAMTNTRHTHTSQFLNRLRLSDGVNDTTDRPCPRRQTPHLRPRWRDTTLQSQTTTSWPYPTCPKRKARQGGRQGSGSGSAWSRRRTSSSGTKALLCGRREGMHGRVRLFVLQKHTTAPYVQRTKTVTLHTSRKNHIYRPSTSATAAAATAPPRRAAPARTQPPNRNPTQQRLQLQQQTTASSSPFPNRSSRLQTPSA